MIFLRFILLSAFFLFCGGHASQAKDYVVSPRDGFLRFALTLPDNVEARTSLKSNVITIRFDGEDQKFISSIDTDQLQKDMVAIDKIVVQDQTLVLHLNQAVSDTRNFELPGRVVVDVFVSADDLRTLKTKKETVIKKEPKPVEDKTQKHTNEIDDLFENIASLDDHQMIIDLNQAVDKKIEKNKKVAEKKDKPRAPIEPVIVENTKIENKKEYPSLGEPLIISISSVKPFNFAAFKRFDRLFIVTDNPNLAVPPQVQRRKTDDDVVFKEIPVSGGRGWSMPIHPDAYVRPEGKGLVWRLIISDQDPKLKTGEMIRFVEGQDDPYVEIKLRHIAKIVKVSDPDYGDDLAVIVASHAQGRNLKSYNYVDFDVMPAVVGAVIKPKADGIRVAATLETIKVSKKTGLNIDDVEQNFIVSQMIEREKRLKDNKEKGVSEVVVADVMEDIIPATRIFYFSKWSQNVEEKGFYKTRTLLEKQLVDAPKSDKLEHLLTLARFMMSQNMGHEALGYLRLAKEASKQIVNAPEYHALRGASHYIAAQYDKAEEAFQHKTINKIPEIDVWLTAARAAQNKDIQISDLSFSKINISAQYSPHIRIKVLGPIILAQIEKELETETMDSVRLIEKTQSANLTLEERATISYLKGRAMIVAGRPADARKILYKTRLSDRLGPYGARSELLLIEDALIREDITYKEAIKRLERLRFVWRGDALETKVYEELGKAYIQNDFPRRGLTLMKRAAEQTENILNRRVIIRYMVDVYKGIFDQKESDEEALDPVQAMAIYEEFKELTPAGEEGNEIIGNIANKLIDIDLMNRAVTLLRDKMSRQEGTEDEIRTGLRVAAIELIDKKTEQALETLRSIDEKLRANGGAGQDEYNRKVVLLKARALADQGKVQEALFMLEGLEDSDSVIRLRIDTARKNNRWSIVSENLDMLIGSENIVQGEGITEEQAGLILNRAVALNLANDTTQLQEFARYWDSDMKKMPGYNTFRMVTRVVDTVTLGDRESLLGAASEVDLFNKFLDEMKR